jgi:hypothetical protein
MLSSFCVFFDYTWIGRPMAHGAGRPAKAGLRRRAAGFVGKRFGGTGQSDIFSLNPYPSRKLK